MRTFYTVATAVTISIALIACSSNNPPSKEAVTKQTSSQRSASEQTAATTTPTAKPAVQNETVFDVPETYQKEMQLRTEELKDNGAGVISVPKTAIETINERPSVFISLGNNQFALRHIKVDEETETHALVRENIASGEVIVTAGVPKLKTGLQRMTSSHHGHSHGPGGHSH